MIPPHPSPQERFNDAFFGFLDRLFLISSFGEIAALGLPAAAGAIGAKYAALAEGLMKGSAFAAMAAKPGDLAAAALPKDWSRRLTEKAAGTMRGTVDGACFVYAHTQFIELARQYAWALGIKSLKSEDIIGIVEQVMASCPGQDRPDDRTLIWLNAARNAAVVGAPLADFPVGIKDVLASALALTAAVAAAGGFRLDPSGLLKGAPKPKPRSGSARPSRTRRARRAPAP